MAVLTLFFLPSTFLAALFSTDFFDLSSDGRGLTVHQELWIYVVVALILTILVMIIWFWWYRGGLKSTIERAKLKRRSLFKGEKASSG